MYGRNWCRTAIGQVGVVDPHRPHLRAGQAAERDGERGRGFHLARAALGPADHALRLHAARQNL